MLDLAGVCVSLRGLRHAASSHDIDLTLADGEIVGLVGAERGGQVDAVPGRVAASPRASIGGALHRRRLSIDGEADGATSPSTSSRRRVGIGFQNPATQLLRHRPARCSRRSRSGR